MKAVSVIVIPFIKILKKNNNDDCYNNKHDNKDNGTTMITLTII